MSPIKNVLGYFFGGLIKLVVVLTVIGGLAVLYVAIGKWAYGMVFGS